MLELEKAQLKGTYLEYLTEMMKLDLLVIDDFGLIELDLDKCRNLFEVIDGRDGRKSTVIVSQFPVNKLFDMFHDHTYADATIFVGSFRYINNIYNFVYTKESGPPYYGRAGESVLLFHECSQSNEEILVI